VYEEADGKESGRVLRWNAVFECKGNVGLSNNWRKQRCADERGGGGPL
jgi:hypothetical protein